MFLQTFCWVCVCEPLWLVCVVVTEINDSTGARCSKVLKHNFSPMMLKTSGTHKHKWMIANEGTVLCNKQIILIVLAWWDIAYCELPEAGDGGREVLDFLQCTFFFNPWVWIVYVPQAEGSSGGRIPARRGSTRQRRSGSWSDCLWKCG